MERKKLYANTIAALICQVITILCGFILPRFMLSAYGSTINGMVSSVSQFLGVIAFMQLGVGAVVQAALYEPLVKKNCRLISEIYSSASKFFRTIAVIFIFYVIVLGVVYPIFWAKEADYRFTVALIVILAISLFVQYYFGLTNQLLLYADQRAYVPLTIDVITLVLNMIISIWMINHGVSILIVKIGSSLVYILRPVFLMIYVRNNYKIDRHISYSTEPIKQKWSGLTQHVASTVMDNTDVMILTVFSSFENISVYNVYNLIVFGVRQLIVSVTVGIQSFFGHILVQYDAKKIKNIFSTVEIIVHTIISILFSCVFILIVPFVRVYTDGIKDANYNAPLFAFILSMAQALYCFRLIYYIMIKGAGHFKQTQQSAVVEMIINLVTSIVGVIWFGMIGVAIGTLAATLYRAVYFILYLNKNIVFIDLMVTIRRFVTDIIVIFVSYCCLLNVEMSEVSYLAWFFLAIKVFAVVIILTCFCTIIELVLFEKGKWKDIVKLLRERSV